MDEITKINIIKRIITLAFAVLLFSVLFSLLYVYDNKYTHPGIQAANGLLIVSEQDMEQTPIRFLWHGWAFYPDVLLTPDDFMDGNSKHYMQYVSVDQSVCFNSLTAPRKSQGSGTYMLRLRLPDKPVVYALELPEIFSAYKLYINDKFVLGVGNPDPQNYQPSTQNNIVTFEKSGDVMLLLAVSNYSHFYNGMVYPPSFGTPSAVNTTFGLRMAAAIVLDTVALVVAILAFYLGIRLKEKNALLFSFLCLAMLSSTSYALIHIAFVLPIFPLYGIELTSVHLVTTLVVILQNRICDVGKKIARIADTAACLFCILALCYGLFASKLPLPIIQGFSDLVFGFKLLCAAYLFIIS